MKNPCQNYPCEVKQTRVRFQKFPISKFPCQKIGCHTASLGEVDASGEFSMEECCPGTDNRDCGNRVQVHNNRKSRST